MSFDAPQFSLSERLRIINGNGNDGQKEERIPKRRLT
jgi:hypothetical protein